MKKNHNSWSELPEELVITVFERLGFADFSRAKSVCSSWHSASRQFVQKNQVPWLILLPHDTNNTCLTLFNPEEKDKLYKTQAIGDEIVYSFIMATYGSWLVKEDLHLNLFLVNIFTRDRINLPPFESQLGVTKVERATIYLLVTFDYISLRYIDMYIQSIVFWIDHKTKEYIVICALGPMCVVYSKNGDNFWNQVPDISDCDCILYKDHKLYFISHQSIFTVLDFSGKNPLKTFECGMILDPYPEPDVWQFQMRRIVVTIKGDVLMVEGLCRNSIYFCGTRDFGLAAEYQFIFNLETQKIEGLPQFGFDFSLYGSAQWFVPR